MSEVNEVKAEPRANGANALSACLVDGNPEQTARERKIKRRALTISVALQGAGLALLVIAPMLAKPAELVMRTVPPMPIYNRPAAPHREFIHDAPRPNSAPCFSCATGRPVTVIHDRDNQTAQAPTDGFDGIGITIPGAPVGAIPLNDWRIQPKRPDETPQKPKVIHTTQIDPALLTHRVEPVYPALARATRRSGKVELHAVIATDGTVQSLQVVSGDPLLVRSALDAVREWRYKPTYLNGQAVEVDTYITVVYSLQQ